MFVRPLYYQPRNLGYITGNVPIICLILMLHFGCVSFLPVYYKYRQPITLIQVLYNNKIHIIQCYNNFIRPKKLYRNFLRLNLCSFYNKFTSTYMSGLCLMIVNENKYPLHVSKQIRYYLHDILCLIIFNKINILLSRNFRITIGNSFLAQLFFCISS